MEQLGSHRMDFHDISYLSISRKSVEKIRVSLKSGKYNGYFTCRPVYRKGQRSHCDIHLYIANRLYINYIQQYTQFYLFLTIKHHVNLNNSKTEVAKFSETLVPTYQTTKRHVTEDWNSHCLQHECMDQWLFSEGTVVLLVKILFVFYGNQIFIDAFKRACYWTITVSVWIHMYSIWIQSTRIHIHKTILYHSPIHVCISHMVSRP
jgi:hypothetical protein